MGVLDLDMISLLFSKPAIDQEHKINPIQGLVDRSRLRRINQLICERGIQRRKKKKTIKRWKTFPKQGSDVTDKTRAGLNYGVPTQGQARDETATMIGKKTSRQKDVVGGGGGGGGDGGGVLVLLKF